MTNSGDDVSKHSEMFVRYFDDSLDDQELAELNSILESSSEARELFNEMVLQSQCVAEMEAVSKVSGASRAKAYGGWGRWFGATAAATVAVIALLIFWPEQSSSEPQIVAQFETINGVAGPEGQIVSGTSVYTRGAGSSARLVYPDGTEVLLDNDSRLLVDGDEGKDLQLLSGHVTANVAPQPSGQPLLVRTQQAVAEVLGTELSIDAEDSSTALSVREGIVRLRRLSDGQAVDIHAGQFAVTDGRAARDLGTQNSPVLPDEFSLSFDRKLPSGWRAGKRLKTEAPLAESFVRAEPVEEQPRGTHYQIYTQNAYYEGLPGLFRIHDDTHLHLTYRMDKPGWFQIFVGVRPDSSASAQRANFLLQPSNDGLKAGEWRTLRVPFSKLRNLQGDEVATGQHAYFILLDTQVEDRGLELQRFWVTRGPSPVGDHQ